MRKLTCKVKKLAVCAAVCGVAVFGAVGTEAAGQNVCAVHASETAAVKAGKTALPSKLYKKVKGWWADASSGGYDRKVTKTCVKAYDRATGKLAYKSKIYGWKKTSGGYLIKLKYPQNKAKYCYVYNEEYDVLEYHFDSWDADGSNYSGSSSMERMKK